MKIRRFGGETMAAALRDVKAVLGAQAIILDTAETSDGVTVTAAVDVEERSPESAGDVELVHEVRHLLDAVHSLVDERWRTRRPVGPRAVAPLHRALVAQGVDGVIATALVRETASRLARGTALDAALARALGRGRRRARPGRIRLFVGPPGDGKTTTIVKLAARARQAGERVTLIGTDTYRIGARSELETYGQALGATVHTASDPDALRAVLAQVAATEVVLIDTAGVGPGQAEALAELVALARATDRRVTRTLVASATTGSWAAGEMWRAFAPLRPDSGVLTKCDLAPGGPMLGLLWGRRVPVTHVTTGRRVPDDLEPATPERLARCLLAA